MVKAKLEKHIKQDPVSVIILILVFMALSVGVLIYMHFLQNREIRQLREDVTTLQRDTHTR
jgi:predicted PurR-regulated permease PerM